MLLFDVGKSGSKRCLNKYLKIYAKQSSFNREEQERSTEQKPGIVSIIVDKAHAEKARENDGARSQNGKGPYPQARNTIFYSFPPSLKEI